MCHVENIAHTRILLGLPLLAFSLSLLLFLLLLVRRLEHNTAGVFGGALYYDSCIKLDKSCFLQGVGPLSGSRAVLLRNNRARAGGAVYVECREIGNHCAEAFGADNRIGTLPKLPKVEFAGNAAFSYGNDVATKGVSMAWHERGTTSIIELVPGQRPLSLAVKLFDSQGSLVKGSEDIIEVLICAVTDACTLSSASVPAVNQGFDFVTGLSNIKTNVECAAMSDMEMVTEMLFQIRVIGAEFIPKVSGRIRCMMCRRGQRMVTYPSRGTWSCEVCGPDTYNLNPLTGKCLVCPSSATCVNGVPIFGASTVRGAIKMEMAAGSSDDETRDALADKMGIEVWHILLAQLSSQRSSQKIEFTFVSNTTQIVDLTARLKSLGAELGDPEPLGPQLAAGEVWEEVDGSFLLRSCPPGHQLLNVTAGGSLDKNAQRCLPCKPNTYIIDQMFPCQKCPKGATCPNGVAFLSNAAGSEWTDQPAADGGLQKRILSCPAGERG